MSEPDRYESPKEVSSPPTVKDGVAVGALLLLSIPAGCVCGGVTCHKVAAATRPNEVGIFLGMLLGFAIVVLVPILSVWLFAKRKSP